MFWIVATIVLFIVTTGALFVARGSQARERGSALAVAGAATVLWVMVTGRSPAIKIPAPC